MHVQTSCFAHKTNCFLTLSLLKVPFVDLCLCSQSSQMSLRRTPLVPTPRVRLRESQIKGFKNGTDQFWVSVLPRCPSYRELNKGSQERQGPTLGVRPIESQIKGVKKGRDQLWVSVLPRCPFCPLRESRLYTG